MQLQLSKVTQNTRQFGQRTEVEREREIIPHETQLLDD